ncbi:palmitoyltransferase pfa5-like protein [Acrodontium crateriforme]|uniref:Palmitoyltransferase n=1 Tax=Acrodontium crateriforme TaxID=150365 RepID=A0AAQ3MEB9_9PEZI|nr:palmitoyltransferase pfa5-like protein [Acrodontium crateriforme]
MASNAESQRRKGSLATARVVPTLLALIVVYASYVVVGPLSINYLINGPNPRITAGLTISIIWFLLVIPTAVSWARLLHVVARHPGYVAQGGGEQTGDPNYIAPGLEEFYNRDVFVCDSRGLPIWCAYCQAWKPDRAHHNQDTGRCTLKMDHFCPWVGGVVGERAMKFFAQFLVYSLILSSYGLVVLAYFLSETRYDVQWIVALSLAGFFVFFTAGMIVNTVWMALKNVTTIENITARRGTMLLAVLLPPDLQAPQGLRLPSPVARTSRSKSDDGSSSDRPLTSDLDDASHQNYFNNGRVYRGLRHPSRSKHWKGTITYPLALSSDQPPLPAPISRTFAILETSPGTNPWDLGTPWRNFTAVFGDKLHHWLLPVRHSPCCDHSSMVSQYPLGPQFEQLLADVGLTQYHKWNDSSLSGVGREGRKRKRKLEEGWRNGERPDGWPTKKEVGRMRREASRKRIRAKRGVDL